MADAFDPYYTWLAIPKAEQPPDHYRLLGLPRYEENLDVISNAMDQRSAYLRTLQTGKHAVESQRLLNEVAAAAGCLLSRERKSAYDIQLREQEELRANSLAATPIGVGSQRALKPQYSATLLPRPEEVSAVILPAVSAAAKEPVRQRPSTALIGAAIAVPAALAILVAVVLALGGDGEPVVENMIPEAKPAIPSALPPKPTEPPQPPVLPKPTDASATPVSTQGETPLPTVIRPGAESPPLPVPKFEPGRGVDLLPFAAYDLRLIRGDAKYESESRVLRTTSESTAFTLPADFPDEYVLEADVTRESGTNSLCLGFPVHGRPLTAVIDGFFSKVSGLASINSREIYTDGNPQATPGQVLTNGQQAKVRIEVTAEAVRLSVDGKPLASWNWEPAATVRSAQGMPGGDLTRLHVFTWDAAYRITRLELLPVP